MRETFAVRYYRNRDVILPGHANEIAAWMAARREEADRDE